MNNVTDYPLLVFVLSFFVLWLSARIGASVLQKQQKLEEDMREDFGVILATTLTLLGLLIGFSFSMAMSRYDQRKTYEEAEANAIGTEYVRADLLPAAEAVKVRALLRNYLDQRVLFYTATRRANTSADQCPYRSIADRAVVRGPGSGAAQPTPIVALAVSGMNDVLNSQGYTQAAWWNRIPIAAWGLMAAIAICCNVLLGFGARNVKAEAVCFWFSRLSCRSRFFSSQTWTAPRHGIIRVNPQNLASLVDSLRAH